MSKKNPWRKDNNFVGLRGRTEPNYIRGSSALYGTGADIVPIDAWQRNNLKPAPQPEHRYAIHAWFKFGHLTEEQSFRGYASTVDEGKRICDEWLSERAK